MRKSRLRSSWLIPASLVAVVVLSLFLLIGCFEKYETPSAPKTPQELVNFSRSSPRVQAVMEVQNRHTPELMTDPEIVATATGMTDEGQLAIIVYTRSRPVAVAKRIEGVPVVVRVCGVIRPMKGKPGTQVNHRAKQTPPIQLGTSGGWKYDLANGYCCGGTLGSLVTDGIKQYILSNYHIFQGDIEAGGNNRVARAGDPVIQPGLIDVYCYEGLAQEVATLSTDQRSLPGSNVDAAVAEVIPGMVASDGSILEIGTISSSTVEAYLGEKVKKSGRTTGLSRSSIVGLNATVMVSYDTECAGDYAFTKTFTGQIIIRNRGGKFLAGGDSGSLMVEDVDANPRAVGLLYAGSRRYAVANPIEEVLSYFSSTLGGNFSMVGN